MKPIGKCPNRIESRISFETPTHQLHRDRSPEKRGNQSDPDKQEQDEEIDFAHDLNPLVSFAESDLDLR